TGTAVHSTAERSIKDRLYSPIVGALSAPDVVELYQAAAAEHGLTPESYRDGYALVEAWIDDMGIIDPDAVIGVEREIDLELAPGIALIGYIDLILQGEKAHEIRVIDYK